MSLPALYVALDAPNIDDAGRMANELKGLPLGFKVGMELFYGEGMAVVQRLQASTEYPVFVDLKLHDIPNTVSRASANLVRQGVRFFNVHAQGGPAMMSAAMDGAVSALPSGESPDGLTVLAVTLLTSLSVTDVSQHLQVPLAPEMYVAHLAKAVQQAGLTGVVCSAQEAAVVREACGEDFLKITPGIRLPENDTADQQRVMTPDRAMAQGATTLVVGRPITQAKQPRAAAEAFIAAIQSSSSSSTAVAAG